MFASIFTPGNVDTSPVRTPTLSSGYSGSHPDQKITALCLFVFAEVGWCPVWRTYFSTPSLRAKRWSLSLSSSLWVISTFPLPLLYAPWTVKTHRLIWGPALKHLPHAGVLCFCLPWSGGGVTHRRPRQESELRLDTRSSLRSLKSKYNHSGAEILIREQQYLFFKQVRFQLIAIMFHQFLRLNWLMCDNVRSC